MDSEKRIESWEVRSTTSKVVDVLCELNAIKDLMSEEYTERDLLQKLLKVQDKMNSITYDVNSYVRTTTDIMSNALKDALADNNTLVVQCADWQKRAERAEGRIADIKDSLGDDEYDELFKDTYSRQEQPF